jgi:nucleoside-diphosphate-sugar epimerase
VTTTTCAVSGNRCVFVHLGAGRTLVEAGDAEDAVRCALEALEGEIAAPYRAVAQRRSGDAWSVGAIAVEVAELAGLEGDELVLTVPEDGRPELVVDGRPSDAGLDALTRYGGARYETYVLRAARLEDTLWEVSVDPL